MKPSERISAAIRGARNGMAIVAFITAGYPKREQFEEHLTRSATRPTWWRSACRSPTRWPTA